MWVASVGSGSTSAGPLVSRVTLAKWGSSLSLSFLLSRVVPFLFLKMLVRMRDRGLKVHPQCPVSSRHPKTQIKGSCSHNSSTLLNHIPRARAKNARRNTVLCLRVAHRKMRCQSQGMGERTSPGTPRPGVGGRPWTSQSSLALTIHLCKGGASAVGCGVGKVTR